MVGGADSMLRVCTWNINLGVRLDEVLDAVSTHRDFAGLDLFALQEASVHHGHPDGHAVAALLGPDYECHQVTAQTIRGHIQANAMIWNRRRVKVDRFDHLQLAGGRSLYKQQRNSVVVEGESDRVSLLAYSVHLDIFGAAHKREQVLDVMKDRLARPPADLTIVAGDLNLFQLSRWPSWSKLIEAYEAEGFADAARRIRWTHSHRALPIKQKLDSILVRSPAGVKLRSWTVEARGSDHIPLFADIS
jgi:endonuclease/exonuclease/phosphatase family metal-dependent hydrolase